MKKQNSNKLNKIKLNRWDSFLTKLAIFVAVLLVIGGGIGMVLIQKELQKSQDLRQQAYVAGGKVTIVVEGSDSAVGQETKLIFKIKTASVLTDGAQLTFNVITNTFAEFPQFRSINSSLSRLPAEPSLGTADSAIEKTGDGFLISAAFLPTPGTSFPATQADAELNGNTFVPFAELIFTPINAGTIALNFDNENSFVPEHGGASDELLQIATVSFNIGSGDTPACTYTYSGWSLCENNQQTRTVVTQTPNDCTGTPSLAQSCSPGASPSPSPEPTPNPTSDPGTGGFTPQSCNQSCSSNNDCENNHRCYDGLCRLATNVSSSTCSAPPDMGLNFGCNEYCADSRECSADLTCQENKCRNPENFASVTCADLTPTQRSSLTNSCNQSCSSNNDCDVNLRCYQGACRLATNPGSFSCSASNKTNLSQSLYGAKSKGADDGSNAISAKKAPPGKKDILTQQKNAPTISDQAGSEPKEETALDFIKNWFAHNPQFPIVLIGLGLAIIVIILIISIIKTIDKNRKPPTPQGGNNSNNSQNDQYEQNLQSKIDALKNSPMHLALACNCQVTVL